jgi:hypothetical protein
MTKKKIDISEYCTAREAAQILTHKLGRPVRPDYIHRVQGVGSIPVNKTTRLYLRADVLNASVRQRQIVNQENPIVQIAPGT